MCAAKTKQRLLLVRICHGPPAISRAAWHDGGQKANPNVIMRSEYSTVIIVKRTQNYAYS